MMSNKIKFKKMTITEARRWGESVDAMSEEEFNYQIAQWRLLIHDGFSEEYAVLRQKVIGAFAEAGGTSLPSLKMSPLDIEVGLVLYEQLHSLGFTLADASDDDVWRYLSVKVFPDITYLRFPKAEKAQREIGGRINQKRFFSAKWRIWVKSLWWYVHLSWQGTESETRRVLEGNGSDLLSHFIETPGRGHRIECSRALMREYASRRPRVTPAMFDAAMKLYGAECRVVEPELASGGISGFCRQLFDAVEKNACA